MVGNSSRRGYAGLFAAAAVFALAAVTFVSAAVAAPPLETVLQVGKAESQEDIESRSFGPAPGCPFGRDHFTLYRSDGRGYGSMSICYTRSRDQIDQVLYTATITLNIPGGRIVAEGGTSLLETGPPGYGDPSDWCGAGFITGGPVFDGIVLAKYFECRATVIDATGIYAGITGTITFKYGYEYRQTTFPMTVFSWATVPRLTLDLQPA